MKRSSGNAQQPAHQFAISSAQRPAHHSSGSADMERGYAKRRKFPDGNIIVRCMSCGNFKTSYSNLAIWQIALQCRLCDSWICDQCVESDGDPMDQSSFMCYSYGVYVQDSKFLCLICSETPTPKWKKQRRAAQKSAAWKRTITEGRIQVNAGAIEGVVSLKCHRYSTGIKDLREPSFYCNKHLIFESAKCLWEPRQELQCFFLLGLQICDHSVYRFSELWSFRPVLRWLLRVRSGVQYVLICVPDPEFMADYQLGRQPDPSRCCADKWVLIFLGDFYSWPRTSGTSYKNLSTSIQVWSKRISYHQCYCKTDSVLTWRTQKALRICLFKRPALTLVCQLEHLQRSAWGR